MLLLPSLAKGNAPGSSSKYFLISPFPIPRKAWMIVSQRPTMNGLRVSTCWRLKNKPMRILGYPQS